MSDEYNNSSEKGKKESNDKAKLYILILMICALAIFAISDIVKNNKNNASTEAVEASVSAEVLESNGDTEAETQLEKETLSSKEVIINEIEELISGDADQVQRYFGESEVYTGLNLKDRLAVSKVNFIDNANPVSDESTLPEVNTENSETSENGKDGKDGLDYGIIEETVHICNIDYNKTNRAIEQLTARIKSENPTITEDELNDKVTKEVAARAQNGEFDIHITMPVEVEYTDGVGKVKLTEKFKAALTGGWYNPTGVELENSVDSCPIRQEAQKKFEESQNEFEKARQEFDKAQEKFEEGFRNQ